MSMQPDEIMTETFKALSHPLRQDIILILAEHKSIGFTALQNELNRKFKSNKAIQVGTIYHHVKLLGKLLEQDEKTRSWYLSDTGWTAYNLLKTSHDRNEYMTQGDLNRASLISIIWRVMAPPELFFFAKKSFILFLGWQLIFILFFAFLTSNASLVLFFVFFVSDLNPNQDILLSLGSILFSWLLITLITLVLSRQQLRRKITMEDTFAMIIFSGLSILPLGLFPVLVLTSIFDVSQIYIPLGLSILLQFWVILLTARGISVQFFVRGERAGIVALTSIYVMVILGIIFGF
ncbi:MAG: hypothetical protein ACXAC8_12260 [Candidatus Hodarchaeales archaeon]|jgi:hypothetical protein